jgi:hypothetical protein
LHDDLRADTIGISIDRFGELVVEVLPDLDMHATG